jgi:selenocysteine lyase/cysteine desulfurase
MTTRRTVLAGAAAGAAVGTVALAGCGPERDAPPRPPAGADWRGVRDQFELDRTVANFAAFVFASHPAGVRAAIDRHRRGLDRDPTGYLAQHEATLDRTVAEAAARYLGGSPDQIAFTDSTTAGLGLLYTGLRLAPGDEVLTSEHDFYATHEALRLRAERDGATVRRVTLYRDSAATSADEIVSALRAALTPKTRVVALTWVHSGTGVRLPVRALADAVAAHNTATGAGALLCLDAVHGFGAVAEQPGRLGVDFLVSGCHKWLFGPRGTGLVWGSPAGWERYTPVVPSFERAAIGGWITGRPARVPAGPAATPGGYHSFEHRWALAEAFAFHTGLGPDRVAARTRELAGALAAGLAGIDGVVLHTPRSPELSAGIVCCEVRGVLPGAAARRLRAAGVVASTTPYARELLRFGASILTADEDVERALAAVRQLR